MELENLIFEKAPIAMVTVNRPKALNALNVRVVEELGHEVTSSPLNLIAPLVTV